MINELTVVLILTLTIYTSILAANPGESIWVKSMGGQTSADLAEVTALALDQSGNIVVAAKFYGTIDVGGQSASNPSGSAGIFIAKFDPAKNLIWMKNFANGQISRAAKIVVDEKGDAIVCGFFQTGINFGRGNLVSKGHEDIFLAKLSGLNGACVWSKSFGSSEGDFATGVAVNANNEIVLTGYTNGQLDIGGGALTNAGSADIFVAKFSVNGRHLWSERFGGTGSDQGVSIVASVNGDVLVTGIFSNTVNFTGDFHTALGGYDMFLTRVSGLGALRWVHSYGGTGYTNPFSVAVNAKDETAVTGTYAYGTAQFGSTMLPASATPAIFVTRFDANGNPVWAVPFGGGSSSKDKGTDVAIDNQGEVYFTGFVRNIDGFIGGYYNDPYTASVDAFVAKLGSAQAEHRWGARYYSDTDGTISVDFDSGQTIALNEKTNEVFIGGVYSVLMDFGTTVGVVNTSHGGPADGFFVKVQR